MSELVFRCTNRFTQTICPGGVDFGRGVTFPICSVSGNNINTIFRLCSGINRQSEQLFDFRQDHLYPSTLELAFDCSTGRIPHSGGTFHIKPAEIRVS